MRRVRVGGWSSGDSGGVREPLRDGGGGGVAEREGEGEGRGRARVSGESVRWYRTASGWPAARTETCLLLRRGRLARRRVCVPPRGELSGRASPLALLYTNHYKYYRTHPAPRSQQ
jgi:hypothetical protein